MYASEWKSPKSGRMKLYFFTRWLKSVAASSLLSSFISVGENMEPWWVRTFTTRE